MTRHLAALLALAVVAPSPARALCTANTTGTPQSCVIQTRRPHVRLTRDEFGVPHLRAHTLYDVGYGTGLAQAQDRLFQMEFVRKSATGNLAEVAGRGLPLRRRGHAPAVLFRGGAAVPLLDTLL